MIKNMLNIMVYMKSNKKIFFPLSSLSSLRKTEDSIVQRVHWIYEVDKCYTCEGCEVRQRQISYYFHW